MKNSISLSFFLTIILLSNACSYDDVRGGDKGSFSATINGRAWKSTEVFDNSYKLQKVLSSQDEKARTGLAINFNAANAVTGKVITICRSKVYEGLSVTTFDSNGLLSDAETAGSGIITITNATSKKAEGTFSSKDPKSTITDGKFSITLTKFF
jgi:hypothetical protein